MQYRRMPIEIESPEEMGYDKIRNNLSESSYTDTMLGDFLTSHPATASADNNIGQSPSAVDKTSANKMSADKASPVNQTGINAGIDLTHLLLCYGSHQGHDGLRELIIKETPGFNKDHVLVTIGAAGALFIIATTLLEKGDELVVVHPNYATNLETPRAIGATIKTIDLTFEEGFALDIKKLEAAITPRTKYVSVTHPNNPTGACLTETQLKALARIAEANNLYVLVDETYRDMVFGTQHPLAATYSEKIISISSLSKTYGLPGLRTGWIVCQDTQLMDSFLAAKEQIHICGPIIDEELAYRYLKNRDTHFPRIRTDIAAKFTRVKTWMQDQDQWEWVEPRGGCVCFPRMRYPESVDIDRYYKILLEKYGTYVGPGHWFEMPRHYIRLGFGWPTMERLEEGLEALTKAVKEATIFY